MNGSHSCFDWESFMPMTLYSVSVQYNQYERISIVSGPHPRGCLVLLHTALGIVHLKQEFTVARHIVSPPTGQRNFYPPTVSWRSPLLWESDKCCPSIRRAQNATPWWKGQIPNSRTDRGTVERTRAAQYKFGARRKLTASETFMDVV